MRRPKTKQPVSDKTFYVHTLASPDGPVFYVGKGKDFRIDDHEKEARRGCNCRKCNVIRMIWSLGKEIRKFVIFTTDDEEEAYNHEIEIIRRIGLNNLTNATAGGDGSAAVMFPKPSKPVMYMTEDEYIAFLRLSPFFDPEELPKTLETWRMEKMAILAHNLRYYRHWKDDEEKVAARAEYERIRAARWKYHCELIGEDIPMGYDF
jgi:hypothetical protein